VDRAKIFQVSYQRLAELGAEPSMWLKAAGVEGIDSQRGPVFNSSGHALQAAIQGEGVVLGSSILADYDIAAGRLVRPFAFSLPADLAYYVVCPPKSLQKPKVKAFREWLMAEVTRDPEK